MINTIQFNNKEYYRIAVKRDVEAVAQTRYGFFYAHWSVLIDGISYQFFSPKPINGVYTLEGTNMTIPESDITTTVYEGMEVTINMSNSVQTTTGTLHINSSYFNYGCSKSTVDQSECKLKWPSVNYNLDRLVREEDIIKPDTVKLYFDENHIDVECFTKFDIPDYSIVTGTYTGYISRSINDSLNANVQRSRNSQSYITCHIGDTIKIISKSKALKNVAIRSYVEQEGDYPIIAPVDENGNINVINLQNDGSFDYTITSDCFVTFDIAAANYTLYGAILEDTEYCDHCGVQVNGTDFIIAGQTDEAKRFIQENSKVNINTSLSIYTVEAYIKERDGVFAGEPKYVIVDNNHNPIYDTAGQPVYVDSEEYDGQSLLTNQQGQIILGTNSTPLDVQDWYNLIEVINLTTNTKVTVNYNNDGSQGGNRSAYFNMPASDCLLTVTTNIITGGDTVTISPRYSLTIDVDENSKNIFPISITTGNTTTEYNSSTTIRNIENNYFSATWNKIDSKLYHIQYKDNHNTIFFDQALKTTSYSNSLMGNRTLSIRLIDPDIIYRNTTEISTITTGKEYEENNNIISNSNVRMALNDYPRRTYYANTESPIKTSNTHFNNLQELKKVIFNNTDTTFTVDADAFYNCLKLESVTINGTENIKVKDRAFYNNIMLTEFNDLNKITELGHSCFYGSALNEYTSNVKLKNIPELAFSKSSLSAVNLAGSPIDPAELTSIDNSAFSNCQKLNTVHLPYALSRLGQGVFENTSIPCVHTNPAYAAETVFAQYGVVFNVYDDYTNQLTILPKNTFKYCANLVEVHLPKSIEYIETCAFENCINLTKFVAPGLWRVAKDSFKGTLIDKSNLSENDRNHLTSGLRAYIWSGNTVGHSYIHPDSSGVYIYYKQFRKDPYHDFADAISVTPYACYKKGYNAICMGKSMRDIGEYAFYSAGIESVSPPTKVNTQTGKPESYDQYYKYISPSCTIHKYAFAENKILREFRIEHNNLHYIHAYAFQNCIDLLPLDFIGCGVKYIGDYAFDNTNRYAYDLYNSLKWTENIVLMAALTAYAFISTAALIAAYPEITPATEVAENVEMPDYESFETIITNDTIQLGGEEKSFRYFEFTLNGQPIDYNNPPWKNFKYFTFSADPEDIAKVVNTTGIADAADEYANEMIDIFNDTMSQYTQNGWIIGNGDEAGKYIYGMVNAVDNTHTIGSILIQKFNGNPIHLVERIRTIAPGRFSTKSIELVKTLVKGATKKIVTKISAPILKNVLEVAGFAATVAGTVIGAYDLIGTIHNVVWSAYKFPIIKSIYADNIKYSGSLSFTTGIGLDVDRGVYTLAFPATIEYIGKYAFRNNKDVRNIIFLESPKKIEEGVFEGCEYLRSVQICKEVTDENGSISLQDDITNYHIIHISNRAFMHCNLDSMEINKIILQTQDVGDYAFAYNKRIWANSLYGWDIETIKKYVTYIIDIPPTLKTIGQYAFAGANLIRFNSAYPHTFNIDPKAFAYYCPYNDWGGNMDISAYFHAAPRVAFVPEQYYDEYVAYFKSAELLTSGSLSGGFAYIVTYNDNNEFTNLISTHTLI